MTARGTLSLAFGTCLLATIATYVIRASLPGVYWTLGWLTLVVGFLWLFAALGRRMPSLVASLFVVFLLALTEFAWNAAILAGGVLDRFAAPAAQGGPQGLTQAGVDAVYNRLFGDKRYFTDGIRMYHMPPNFRSAVVSTNSFGTRGPEIAPKAKGVYRILLLGGSGAFGYQVSRDDLTAAAELERRLNQQSDGARRFEVVNLGLPNGHSVFDYVLLSTYGPELQPDLVLFYTALNDVRGIFGQLPWLSQRISADLNDATAGTLGLATMVKANLAFAANVLGQFRTYQAAKAALSRLGPAKPQEQTFSLSDYQGFLDNYARQMERIFRLARQQGWECLVIDQPAALLTMARRAELKGRESLTDSERTYLDEHRAGITYQVYVERHPLQLDLLRERAGRHGFDYVDIADALARADEPLLQSKWVGQPQGALFVSETHLSDYGNARLAGLMQDQLATHFPAVFRPKVSPSTR